MKTLRLVIFNPSQNVASRYWEEDGFRRNDQIQIASLTGDQQAVVAGALAWATAHLPTGFSALESVELRRNADVPTEWTAGTEEVPAVPTAYGPSFTASIVGNGTLGQQAIEIGSDGSAAFVELAALWDQISV